LSTAPKKDSFITPTGGRTGSEMMLCITSPFKKYPYRNHRLRPKKGELVGTTARQTLRTIPIKVQLSVRSLREGVYNKIKGCVPDMQLKRIQKKAPTRFWHHHHHARGGSIGG
jgi:hypothetical protein